MVNSLESLFYFNLNLRIPSRLEVVIYQERIRAGRFGLQLTHNLADKLAVAAASRMIAE